MIGKHIAKEEARMMVVLSVLMLTLSAAAVMLAAEQSVPGRQKSRSS